MVFARGERGDRPGRVPRVPAARIRISLVDERAVRVGSEAGAVHRVRFVVGVADIETVVAVDPRKVIAFPPSFDETIAGLRGGARNAEIVRHRAEAEIVLE